jgi:hypothetical protein
MSDALDQGTALFECNINTCSSYPKLDIPIDLQTDESNIDSRSINNGNLH